jgi:DNA-binding beta-propeller fold protein YncE
MILRLRAPQEPLPRALPPDDVWGKAMVFVIRTGFRLSRWCSLAVAAVFLIVLASSCSGDDPRSGQSEEQGESRQTTETRAARGQAEKSGATQPSELGEPERKPRPLVWVALENANEIVLVDIAKGKVLARHDTPGGPHNVTVAADGTAAATLYASDRLVLVGQRKARFLNLGGTPHDVKAARGLFVVANEAARRLDLVEEGEHAASIELKAEPHDLAIAPGGDRAWATLNGTDELAVVDLRARRVERYVSTGQSPHDILFAPDGTLWVTDWNGPVHVFDRRGKLRGRIALGEESHHLAFTPDGKQAWITDHAANRTFIVDVRRLKLVDSVRVSGRPHHVAITADGGLAAVVDHDNGTVVVYDVKQRARVRAVHVGAGPHGVWTAPAGKTSSIAD